MDRIPTTTDGALGGNRDTAANPMAVVLPARFSGRRVSEALEAPRLQAGRGRVTGSGVLSAEEHRGIRSRTATGSPASSGLSGATVLPPGSLPKPSPPPTYRSMWKTFVAWCEERHVEHWPASPETVADYLKDRAEKRGLSMLRSIRFAISETHRAAGFRDRFARGIVRETLKELATASGWQPSRRENISGSSLDAAEIEAIRAAALEPRRKGSGIESRETATRRGRVDLALCSLVLEAGLRCEQAATLEWRDLGIDENGKPAIRSRTGSAEPGDVVSLSERAWCDLEAIAPESPVVEEKIFPFDSSEVAGRIRVAARAAGLEGRIAGESARAAHRESGHDDPCRTPLVKATLNETLRPATDFAPRSLDADALKAIRAAATTPRKSGRGRESAETARRRGLVDIALCSVLLAARLSVEQAVLLKWREMENLGPDKARLRVWSRADIHGSGEFREIAGEAVRDLEAIRGDALPEDTVFGLSLATAYKRIKAAASSAGLGISLEAGSSRTATAGPSHTDTAGPSHLH